MVWAVIGGLILVLLVGGLLVRKSGSSSTVNRGTRAVIVPTDDAARTLVVPPCGTGAPVASRSAARLRDTTGATTIELPRGQGVRVVLVPRCTAGRGASAGTSPLPSALFVAKPGTPLPPVKPGAKGAARVAEPGSAQSQLTVPSGSPIRTIVVAPCERAKAPRPTELLLGVPGGSKTALAPRC